MFFGFEEIPFIVALLILIVSARVMGEVFERFGLPSMIGEILAGVLLGPSVTDWINLSSELRAFSDVGVLLLVILAGMEIRIKDVIDSFKGKKKFIGILGFAIPFVAGGIVGYIFNFNTYYIVFIGLCIAITALPVSIRILIDLKLIHTDFGKKIISAAVFNDIISLFLLGIILIVGKGTQNPSAIELTTAILITFLKLALFILFIFAANRIVNYALHHLVYIRKKIESLLSWLKGQESIFALFLIIVLIFASLSEVLGLHFVVGAFIGTMLIPEEIIGTEHNGQIKKSLNGITMGFFSPVFFAVIGVEFNIDSISHLSFFSLLLSMAIISKFVGGYLGAKIAGSSNRKATAVGLALNARGLMELVIANIALRNGFINIEMFSILILIGIITTVISPISLKWMVRKYSSEIQ